MNINDLQKLHEAATSAPWEWHSGRTLQHLAAPQSSRVGLLISAPSKKHPRCPMDSDEDIANIAIIPAARNALPKLLAVASAAREMREVERKGGKDLLNPDLSEDELGVILAKSVVAGEALDKALAALEAPTNPTQPEAGRQPAQ